VENRITRKGGSVTEGLVSNLGSDPIPGDKPAGGNARYEPEFEQLEAEIGKLGNPAGGEVRWQDVVSLSRTILSEKSKDLLAGSYFAYGMLQQQGLQGLLEGLKVINGMCQAHWEGMFPEVRRMKARESALDWLIDRVTAFLDTAPPPGAEEAGILQQAVQVVDDLTAFVDPKLDAPNPKLSAFVRALTGAGSEARGEGTETAQEATSDMAPSPAPGAGGPTGPITNRKVAFERLREVADFLKRTEPHSPVAYLVNRAIKWGDMSLENVIAELVKNSDVRKQIYETLGVKRDED
jgi:type VI secretion system protein VasJ